MYCAIGKRQKVEIYKSLLKLRFFKKKFVNSVYDPPGHFLNDGASTDLPPGVKLVKKRVRTLWTAPNSKSLFYVSTSIRITSRALN